MTHSSRAELVAEYFPTGIPRLWCPLLTHYDAAGRIDAPRMRAHLHHISPWVRSFLAPGSTGDGWEMNDEERSRLLSLLLEVAGQIDARVLVGVLRTERGEAYRSVQEIATQMPSDRVCGFTVTPPRGADLAQDTIKEDLAEILSLGHPTALYQLPQITENEMSPHTVSELAERYQNFYLFKDTSGADRVAHSGESTSDVFMVRGAEGDYARHLKAAGGSYDGFLLSTANSFPEELSQVIDLVQSGTLTEARSLSTRVEAVVTAVFQSVASLPFGNPFANANKAVDHVRAFHPRSTAVAPPMTHSGERLPLQAVELAERLLQEQDLLSQTGYYV